MYDAISVKTAIFLGSSKGDLGNFPAQARSDAGYELFMVQNGNEPSDWKPMTGIGAGVCEIRVRDSAGAFRVIYVANIGDAVYVLHAFHKKTQKTAKRDLDLAVKRYKEIPK